MRKTLPLVAICLAGLVIVTLLAGGVTMLVIGVKEYLSKSEQTEAPKENAEQLPLEKGKSKPTLQQARKDFKTVPTHTSFKRDLDRPKPNVDAQVIEYPSGVGRCVAYLSKPRKVAGKRPAVVWAHGGFGGIGDGDWAQAKPFHDAGCVLMIPSFRGENDNFGQFEMFYREVDDLLAAVDFVADQPGVDPTRIYVVGHSSGGTIALLAATTGPTKVRAFYSIAGLPDVQEFLRVTQGVGYAEASPPFNTKNVEEGRLRSALPFVAAIKTPTFYIGVRSDDFTRQAVEMERRADSVQVPFKTFILARPDHFKVVEPVVKFLAPRFAAAPSDAPPLPLDIKELDALFTK